MNVPSTVSAVEVRRETYVSAIAGIAGPYVPGVAEVLG